MVTEMPMKQAKTIDFRKSQPMPYMEASLAAQKQSP
jgi:hypothetical protein